MNCPNCRTPNPDGAKFCLNCSNPFALNCPNCGTELPAQARFCVNCGHQLEAKQTGLRAEAQTDAPQPRLDPYMPDDLRAKLQYARTRGNMEGERRVVTFLFCGALPPSADGCIEIRIAHAGIDFSKSIKHATSSSVL